MAKGKAPSFQFYPDAWLSSTDIMLMSPSEEGAYFRLLCHAWMAPDCGLPDDDEQLAVLSRLGRQWERSGSRIRRKFDGIGGRLFNARLCEERVKQDEWRKKSAEGGTKAQANRKGGSRVVEEWLANGTQPNAKPRVEEEKEVVVEDVDVKTSKAHVPSAKNGKRTTEEIKAALGERLPWWEGFWSAYPCHEGMKPALDLYERKVHDRDMAKAVYHGAKAYAAVIEQKRIADPSTPVKYAQGWLNDERWQDENATPKPPRGNSLADRAVALMERRIANGEPPL